MAAASVHIERRAGNGDWFPVPSGVAVRPAEPIRIVYSGFGLPLQPVEVTITIIRGLDAAVVFGPVVDRVFFGGGDVVTQAPPDTALASYSVLAVAKKPLAPDVAAAFSFFVDPAAVPPPPEPQGGFLDSLKGLLIPLAIVAALIVLSPTINRIAGRIGRRSNGD